MDRTTLDPEDWQHFRAEAHALLDQSLARLQNVRDGRVWTPLPEELAAGLAQPAPQAGIGAAEVAQRLSGLLPFGVGNTHPRFFGWVHGAGSPGNILAEIVAAAMNANLGGRNHGSIHVERQVIDWCKQMMGFPDKASGLLLSGTSMATIVALKVARDLAKGDGSRRRGLEGLNLVGYCSEQAHSCISRAFDILGLGSDALRRVPCDAAFRMDVAALRQMIDRDRAEGAVPFLVAGTAGAVNVGAIDPLNALADLCAEEDLWFHVDGAFGAAVRLTPEEAPKVAGMERADSLAFDFHKWFHVNYDAGCVLVRDGAAHLRAFAERPDYLETKARGIASGAPWPVDFGPELSRGNRALKVWAHLLEHGTGRIGDAVAMNCAQARWLGEQVAASDDLDLMAPVALNICCFRYKGDEPDALNEEIVLQLQEAGIAVPSTTRLAGDLAIRVNLTNHRTRISDLQLLLDEVRRIGAKLTGKAD